MKFETKKPSQLDIRIRELIADIRFMEFEIWDKKQEIKTTKREIRDKKRRLRDLRRSRQ